jgi:hypothetical protein
MPAGHYGEHTRCGCRLGGVSRMDQRMRTGVLSGVPGRPRGRWAASVGGGICAPLGPTDGAPIAILLTESLRIGFGTAAVGSDNVVYGTFLVVLVIFLPRGLLGSLLARPKPVPAHSG